MDQTDQSVPIPSALLDAIADRVAERLADRLGEMRGTSAAWMRTNDAAEYLGLTRSALYSRIREIPHYRFERMLLFKRTDLDAWVESHRVDPAPRNDRLDDPASRSFTTDANTACASGQGAVASSSPGYEGAPETRAPAPAAAMRRRNPEGQLGQATRDQPSGPRRDEPGRFQASLGSPQRAS